MTEADRIETLADNELMHARYLIEFGDGSPDNYRDIAEALAKVATRYHSLAQIAAESEVAK